MSKNKLSKPMKRLTSLVVIFSLILITLMGSVATVTAVSKTDITYINSAASKAMYGVENYRSGDCYLSANVYMLRRRAFLDGMDWSGIKADTTPAVLNGGTGARSKITFDEDGYHNNMKWEYYYSYGTKTYHVKEGKLTGTNAAKIKTVCGILDTHPEGIAIWGPTSAGYPHAVLLTHYTKDAKGNVTLYGVDSTYNTFSNNAKYGGYNSWSNAGVQKLSQTTIIGGLSRITSYKYIATSTNRDAVVAAASTVWERLAGAGRYDTMQTIVEEGFSGYSNTVIIASGETFKDALPASGLAGAYGAPVLITDGKKLSAQTKTLLQTMYPSRIIIAGGTFAVSANVAKEVLAVAKGIGAKVNRVYGDTSAKTSAKLALAGKGRWSSDKTAIIATNKGFKDALSAAPIAYAKKYPILLADNGEKLDKDVIDALKTLGIEDVIIVGGTGAVKKSVETQLLSNNIKIKTRLGGANGKATSALIAEWGIQNGMSADKMGVATAKNFPDALAGAALCGHNNAVLVLADDDNSANTSFPKKYKSTIKTAYVFGGESAVGIKTWNALVASVK